MDIRKWFGTSKNKEASSPRTNDNTEPDPDSETGVSVTEDLPSPPAAEESSISAAVRPPPPHPCPAAAGPGSPPVDLGTEEPAQVRLSSYPTRIIYQKTRSFSRSCHSTDWVSRKISSLIFVSAGSKVRDYCFCWFYLSCLRQMLGKC